MTEHETKNVKFKASGMLCTLNFRPINIAGQGDRWMRISRPQSKRRLGE